MPLDPQAREIIEAMTASFPRVDFARSGTENRRLVKEAAARVIPAASEAVASAVDRAIPGPFGAIPLRVYRPYGAGPEPLPVVAFFHGGGWVVCDLDSHDGICRAIANASGCLVVAVDYRLAPEHRFPVPAEDAYAAVQWLGLHAALLGGDPARMAVVGDSAGGNLAAVVALLARDRGGPKLGFQGLVYPVTDFRFDTGSHRGIGPGYFLQSDEVRYYWHQYLADPADGASPYASPLRAQRLSGLPPALVITAEYDPLRDEGEAYARRLAEEGVATVATRYDGMFHGFVSFLTLLPDGRRAIVQVGDELRRTFGLG